MIFQKLICRINANDTDFQSEQDCLKRELKQTKEELDLALHNLNYVIDPDLIDCCIYEVQAAQLRYKVLLREAKRSETMSYS